MANPLVIVDSETKAEALQTQFDGELDTLILRSSPMKVSYKIPKDKLKRQQPVFEFTPLSSEKKFVDVLLEYLDRDIYLAMDCDLRGEYWCWMISGYLASEVKGSCVPRRLHLVGLAREEIMESFRMVESVESEKATAFYIRGLFHSSLGKHLQRLIGTQVGPGNLPLNYYSLTTLFLLAERETEIKTYKPPSQKWEIKVKLVTSDVEKVSPDAEFMARLEEVYGISDDGFFKDPAQGKEMINRFANSPFTVSSVKRSDIVIQPPSPYRMAELLQDAYTILGILPRKVLESVRKLFYGIEVKGSLVGLISSFVPLEDYDMSGIIERIQEHVAEVSGEEALTEEESVVGSDCILPLRPEVSEDDLGQVLDDEERKLYGLIRSRALASWMTAAKGEKIDVEFQAGSACLFRTSLRSITDKGFFSVYQGYHDKELLKPCPLANVEEGQIFAGVQIIPEQTGGFPPEYYTFESLFADMADFSITLDSFFILMIQSMLHNNYIFITADGYLRCKENANKVIATINRAFPTMTGINLSAYLEQTIEEAVSGRKELDFAIKQFEQTLIMRGKLLVKIAMPVKPRQRTRTSSRIIKLPDKPVAEKRDRREAPVKPKAPERPVEDIQEGEGVAGETVVPASDVMTQESLSESVGEQLAPESEEAVGPVAPVVSETGVPEQVVEGDVEETSDILGQVEHADMDAGEPGMSQEVFDQPAGEQEPVPETPPYESVRPEEATPDAGAPGKECPACGRPMLLKSDRFGKFWTCSGFPACRHAEAYEKSAAPQMECPLCKKVQVLAKITPAGKPFFVCPEQNCEFMAWSRPHAVSCQACNTPFLVEKKDVRGKMYLRCPRAGCNYMQPMPGDDGMDVLTSPAPPKKRKVRVRRSSAGAAVGAGGKKRKVRVVRRK
jgi:DNA topoisomerase IA/ssDNA-binding Zn-finger/Zn-ribbon topoisomerase 1